MSKNISFTILQHGWIENDYAWNEAVPYYMTLDDRTPRAKWVKVPSYSVLVRHPQLGNVLYDTGSCPGDEANRLPSDAKQLNSLTIERKDFLDERLNELGMTPGDIDLVIVSHMHWDHAGGLKFFSGTKAGRGILVPGADFSYGLTQTHVSPNRFAGGYLRDNFDFPELTFDLIDDDIYLGDGIRLLVASGHTPRLLTMYIETAAGNYLFVSDVASMSSVFGPPTKMPGILYDSVGYRESVFRLSNFAKEHHAQIVFGHDIEQLADMKKAPFYYGE